MVRRHHSRRTRPSPTSTRRRQLNIHSACVSASAALHAANRHAMQAERPQRLAAGDVIDIVGGSVSTHASRRPTVGALRRQRSMQLAAIRCELIMTRTYAAWAPSLPPAAAGRSAKEVASTQLSGDAWASVPRVHPNGLKRPQVCGTKGPDNGIPSTRSGQGPPSVRRSSTGTCVSRPLGFNMPMTISTNVSTVNAQRNLNASQGLLATSMQRLSSGLRVNTAKDDAAGLAIANPWRPDGASVAVRNANDGISLAQTAEGALAKIDRWPCSACVSWPCRPPERHQLHQRPRRLDTGTSSCREIQRIASQTKFNGRPSSAARRRADLPGRPQQRRHPHRHHRGRLHRGRWPDHRRRRLHRRGRARHRAGHHRPPTAPPTAPLISRFGIGHPEPADHRRERHRRRRPHHGRRLPPPRPPTSRARRSCSRPAPPWSPRPTSCPTRCCNCCSSATLGL